MARSRVPPLNPTQWEGGTYALGTVLSYRNKNWENILAVEASPEWDGTAVYALNAKVFHNEKNWINEQAIDPANANLEPGTNTGTAYWGIDEDFVPVEDPGDAEVYWREQPVAWDDGSRLWDMETDGKVVGYTNVQAVQRLIQQQIPGSGSIQDEAAIAQFLRDAKARIDATLRRKYSQTDLNKAEAAEILGPISASYAADQVFLSQREGRESAAVFTRWRDDLKAIVKGDIDLLTDEEDDSDESFIGSMGGRTYRG